MVHFWQSNIHQKAQLHVHPDLPIFMTWDGSICLGPGWLLGLKEMLAVELRIMPACTGLFTALAVGAQVTLTAVAWPPQSPDVMAGRGALPLIIPAQKPNRLRCWYVVQNSFSITTAWWAAVLVMKMQWFHSKHIVPQLPVWMCKATEWCLTLLSQGTVDYFTRGRSFPKHCSE